MTLNEIGRTNYTDKYNHGYLEIYEHLWGPLKNEPITLLEIGIYNGNSMRTWCEWFPNATIIGIDFNPNNPMRTSRAKIHFGNQADVEFLNGIIGEYGGFDIIIDDGSHKWGDQQITFKTLWPCVKSKGMYIIEDLHTSVDNEYRDSEFQINTIEFLKLLVGPTILDKSQSIESMKYYSKLAVLQKR
jgi:hypothetical protein